MKDQILKKIKLEKKNILDNEIFEISNLNDNERYNVIEKIGFIGNRSSVYFLNRLLELSKCKNDILSIISALGNCRTIINAFMPIFLNIDNKDKNIRNEAIIAIGKHSSRIAVNVLNNKLKNEPDNYFIIRALGMIGCFSSAKVIEKNLKKAKKEIHICECLLALGEIRVLSSSKTILKFLKGYSKKIRRCAIIALSQLGDRETLKILSKTAFNEKDIETVHLLFSAMEYIRRDQFSSLELEIQYILNYESNDFLFLKRNARRLRNYNPKYIQEKLYEKFLISDNKVRKTIIRITSQIENHGLFLNILKEMKILKENNLLIDLIQNLTYIADKDLIDKLFELYRVEKDKKYKWMFLEALAMNADNEIVNKFLEELEFYQEDIKVKIDIIRVCTKSFVFNSNIGKHLRKRFIDHIKKIIIEKNNNIFFNRLAYCSGLLNINELSSYIISELDKNNEMKWALNSLIFFDNENTKNYIRNRFLKELNEEELISILKAMGKYNIELTENETKKCYELLISDNFDIIINSILVLKNSQDELLSAKLKNVYFKYKNDHLLKTAVLNVFLVKKLDIDTKIINDITVSNKKSLLDMLIDILIESKKAGNIVFLFKLINNNRIDKERIKYIFKNIKIPDKITKNTLNYIKEVKPDDIEIKNAIDDYIKKL